MKLFWPALGQRKTSLLIFLWKRRTISIVFLATKLFIMAWFRREHNVEFHATTRLQKNRFTATISVPSSRTPRFSVKNFNFWHMLLWDIWSNSRLIELRRSGFLWMRCHRKPQTRKKTIKGVWLSIFTCRWW